MAALYPRLMPDSAGMCQRYSVIAPELPIAVNHHTRGRRAHRVIAGAARIANALKMIACPASSSDGGLGSSKENRHTLASPTIALSFGRSTFR
jgi:hypothetical protein